MDLSSDIQTCSKQIQIREAEKIKYLDSVTGKNNFFSKNAYRRDCKISFHITFWKVDGRYSVTNTFTLAFH